MQQGGSAATDHACRLRLGTAPGRTDTLQETIAGACQLERCTALVGIVGDLLNPALFEHDLQISGEGGGVQVQKFAELDAADGPGFRDGDEQAELAGFQGEFAKLVVVDAGQHAIEHAPADQQAFAYDSIHHALTAQALHRQPPFHSYLHMQRPKVKGASWRSHSGSERRDQRDPGCRRADMGATSKTGIRVTWKRYLGALLGAIAGLRGWPACCGSITFLARLKRTRWFASVSSPLSRYAHASPSPTA